MRSDEIADEFPPWEGVIVALKPSPSGWRVEIRDDRGDGSVLAEHMEAL